VEGRYLLAICLRPFQFFHVPFNRDLTSIVISSAQKRGCKDEEGFGLLRKLKNILGK